MNHWQSIVEPSTNGPRHCWDHCEHRKMMNCPFGPSSPSSHFSEERLPNSFYRLLRKGHHKDSLQKNVQVKGMNELKLLANALDE